ncbi:MAG: UPF0158 family protein [Thermodesulfovibrionales bacterium]
MKIDFDEIQKAMEDTARDAFDYFLDRETGEIIILSEDIIKKAQEILEESYDDDIGDFEDVEVEKVPVIPEWMEDEIELALDIFIYEKERYARIPERNHHHGYNTMKEFAATLEDEMLKQTLLGLLDGKNAFRRFKDALGEYPKERKLWYGFNAKASRNEIEAWLQTVGLSVCNQQESERSQT